MPDVMREDRLGPVDEEEWGFAGGLSRNGAGRPQHGLKLTEPTPATSLELLLEDPCLEAPQDLCIGTLGLAIAPGMSHTEA